MLIERDGSDTPPGRFAYSADNRAQLSHFNKSRAIKTAAAPSGGMDPCFRSFPPSDAAASSCPDSAPAVAVRYGLITPSEPQNNPYFTATNERGELDGRIFGQLKIVGMQGDNRALLLGHQMQVRLCQIARRVGIALFNGLENPAMLPTNRLPIQIL